MDTLESLPLRPLSQETIGVLKTHDSVNTCFPVYRVADEPDSIVAILLTTESDSRVAVYDSSEPAWKVAFEGELQADAYSHQPDAIRDRMGDVAETVERLFPETEVELISLRESPLFDPENGAFEELLTTFPDRPMTDRELKRVSAEPDVHRIIPHIALHPSGEVVMITGTCDSYENGGTTTFGMAYYSTQREQWVSHLTMPAEKLNSPTTPGSDGEPDDTVQADDGLQAANERVFEIVTEQYSRSQLTRVE